MTINVDNLVQIWHFISEHRNDKMPVSLAFKLHKIERNIEPDMTLFRQKYSEIVNKYTLPNYADDGTLISYTVNEDSREAYQSEIRELSQLEFTYPDIIIKLNEIESLDVTMDELSALMPFIEE